MNIDYPTQDQLPGLRALWKEAFGDDDAFLDQFYSVAFASDRCRCVSIDGKVVAALYWFDCQFEGRPIAYLYAVATKQTHRGKGICRALMENTHIHFAHLGYAGAVLVPGAVSLFEMYQAFGYETCSYVSEFSCAAAEQPAALRAIDAEEFAALRRTFLPKGGVLQEGESIAFLQTMARFYAGEDFLLTVSAEGKFFAPELLGNPYAAPSILTAFGKKEGIFRTRGGDKPFAMYKALSEGAAPTYFGLAFD